MDRNRKHDFSKSTIDNFSRKSLTNENITIVRSTGMTEVRELEYNSREKSRVAIIDFNPNLGLTDGKGNILSPATALQHELGHVANAQYIDPIWGNIENRRTVSDPIWRNKEEEFNIKTHEHGLAIENKELVRDRYSVEPVEVEHALSTKRKTR